MFSFQGGMARDCKPAKKYSSLIKVEFRLGVAY
jgi:hypothetical protein